MSNRTGTIDLRDDRRDYHSVAMHRADMHPNPFVQFEQWLQQATDAGNPDATAMTLATASTAAIPSARIVLLKYVDKNGFCWYTDSRSQKGRQLAQNPHAALLFHWRDLNRQVRITGRVTTLPAQAADDYFYRRPVGSRFSAAASHQTAPLENRTTLQQEVARLRTQYPDGQVPRPEAWLGYRLVPGNFEFWQGRVDRLHDRITYTPGDGDHEGRWELRRLSP